MQLHVKIRMLRYEMEWGQGDVASRLGISIPAYSKIETGITDLNFSRIEQLAALYQLTAVQLLDSDHDPHIKDNSLLLKVLHEQLIDKERQIARLQDKLIELYEQLGQKAGDK